MAPTCPPPVKAMCDEDVNRFCRWSDMKNGDPDGSILACLAGQVQEVMDDCRRWCSLFPSFSWFTAHRHCLFGALATITAVSATLYSAARNCIQCNLGRAQHLQILSPSFALGCAVQLDE